MRYHILATMMIVPLAACAVTNLVDSSSVPDSGNRPDAIRSADGALAAYRGTIRQFAQAFGGETGIPYIIGTGLLTDELGATKVRTGDFNANSSMDERLLPTEIGTQSSADRVAAATAIYNALQNIRGRAREAEGALRKYAPETSPVFVARLFALEAYAEVLLADYFCSGVPLSTIEFEGDFTYRAGSTKNEVYAHAITLFDSAMALGADSAVVVNLARVGKARAYLAMGDFTKAASVAHDVPNNFVYAATYTKDPEGSGNFFLQKNGSDIPEVTVRDIEGINGLNYISAGDPRLPTSPAEGSRGGTFPDKYSRDGNTPIPVASGIEARLIEAEVALHAGNGSWLTTLNQLRTDGTTDVDGTYNAGIGGIAGLEPLEDPVTPTDRLDLLFRERAFWLFLTGQRQGDLRRLVSIYKRKANDVYPTGSFGGGTGLYGSDVNAPIPLAEQLYNPFFRGCIDRGA